MVDLFSLAKSRNQDPETSMMAAETVKKAFIRKAQNEILEIIKEHGPIADVDILPLMKMRISPSGARTRRSELVGRRLVKDSGHRKKLESGRLSILWEIA